MCPDPTPPSDAPAPDAATDDDSSVTYRKLHRYKYQVLAPYRIKLTVVPVNGEVHTDFLNLEADGKLTIAKGYAWDGPSGPTIDTRNFLRASLVHDACYQLIAMGHLRPEDRLYADRLLRRLCREDGMSRFRAWYVYRAVRWFGASHAAPSGTENVALTAP